MARNKESLVLLIEVGPSMHGVLPEVEKVCCLLAEKKLIYGKYDEVGVVAFGTADTKNDLTAEVGGYENVTVLREWGSCGCSTSTSSRKCMWRLYPIYVLKFGVQLTILLDWLLDDLL
ncbi:hypothetical protein SASPL_135483 [Salvia splendens]|uniref:Ku70/Ku80 N-terminal alpha/beta domain-containing protein n=1 Tax=Salvia splendens TaxID=180675 RepID=A0A8X8WY93_SALSN|nr:hypothetical protein SASPL_135483 [Salvia splendens]